MGMREENIRKNLYWCLGSESNRHASRHWILNPARLPIPPPRHDLESET